MKKQIKRWKKQIREYKEAFSENIDELNELSNEFLSGLGYDN